MALFGDPLDIKKTADMDFVDSLKQGLAPSQFLEDCLLLNVG